MFKKSKDNGPDLIHNIKLWQIYLDLEMNLGTVDTIRAAFKRCIDLKVASPFIVISYANFLEKHKFYEDSFKVYENALSSFSWPTLFDIWILYLNKFVLRYQGTRLERTRDLFESVLK